MRVSSLPLVLVLGACSAPPASSGNRAVEEVLETAIAAGHAGAMTMAAVEGTVAACVNVVVPCAGGAGCEFEVEIDAGACPIPIFTAPEGTVFVAGALSTDDTAVVNAMWQGVDDEWVVVGLGSMVIHRDAPDQVRVAYAQQDVEVRTDADAASVELQQHAWTVQVATGATPAAPGDDAYVVNGGHQSTGAGGSVDTLQVAITNATVTPACRRNPTAGTAVLQRTHTGSSAYYETRILTFHAACDGQPFDLTD